MRYYPSVPHCVRDLSVDSRLHLTDPRFTGGKWNNISVNFGSGVSQFNFVSLGIVQIAIDNVRLISGSCNQGATAETSLLLSLQLFLSLYYEFVWYPKLSRQVKSNFGNASNSLVRSK